MFISFEKLQDYPGLSNNDKMFVFITIKTMITTKESSVGGVHSASEIQLGRMLFDCRYTYHASFFVT
jgi:hypothetical protein